MVLFLSKIISTILTPLGICLTLMVIGIGLLHFKQNKFAYYPLIGSLLCFVLFSSPMFANSLTRSLERQYLPKLVEEYPVVDAIVVLGGALSGPYYPRKYLDMGSASDRVLHAFRLYKASRADTIIVSGGYLPFLGAEMSEAYLMKSLLVDWGVPATAILMEVNSRNTAENAKETKKLLETAAFNPKDVPLRLLLVTSALHMPRAYPTFLAQELQVIPAPTDFLVVDTDSNFIFEIFPSSDALNMSTYALREYLGRVYYGLKGWL